MSTTLALLDNGVVASYHAACSQDRGGAWYAMLVHLCDVVVAVAFEQSWWWFLRSFSFLAW